MGYHGSKWCLHEYVRGRTTVAVDPFGEKSNITHTTQSIYDRSLVAGLQEVGSDKHSAHSRSNVPYRHANEGRAASSAMSFAQTEGTCTTIRETMWPWSLISHYPTSTESIPNPSPGSNLQQSSNVREVACFYQRSFFGEYHCRCGNVTRRCRMVCRQHGHAIALILPGAQCSTIGTAIGIPIPGWPQGLPDPIEITIWENYQDSVSATNGWRACYREMNANQGANVVVEPFSALPAVSWNMPFMTHHCTSTCNDYSADMGIAPVVR